MKRSDNMQENLTEVGEGDPVVDSISFLPSTDTSDCYVRAKLQYKSTDTSLDAKKFLLAVNYADITTSTDGATYKWVRHTDGYYYLATTAETFTPLVYTKSITTATKFCENVKYKGATAFIATIDDPSNLSLFSEVQAVQAKNITTDNSTPTLERLSTVFTETFGAEEYLGSIVMFDTNGGTSIIPQTFFNTTSTVTKPTDPSKPNYTFSGWYTDSACTTEYDFNTTVTNSFTLYAKFKEFSGMFGKYDASGNEDGMFQNTYYVEYGSYPQSLYSGDTTSFNLVSGKTYNLKDKNCPVYTDGTNEYVKFESSSTDTTYTGVKYYKVEPVRWLIVGYGDGSMINTSDAFSIDLTTNKITYPSGKSGLTVVSEKVLSVKIFDEYDNPAFINGLEVEADWQNSKIRSYMNDVMFGELFASDNAKIKSTQLTTGCVSMDDSVTLVSQSTNDKLFLLSTDEEGKNTSDNYKAEMINKSQTLHRETDEYVYASLKSKATDMCMALEVLQDNGYGVYWLRSGNQGGGGRNSCHLVTYDGMIAYTGVGDYGVGIRCGMVLNL